jgi:hypothetical protein
MYITTEPRAKYSKLAIDNTERRSENSIAISPIAARSIFQCPVECSQFQMHVVGRLDNQLIIRSSRPRPDVGL